jgi:adenylate cyclase
MIARDGNGMTDLNVFIPQDRLRALALGASLPERAEGSVLIADISGFVPLTETLRMTLGPRRGAETVTQQLDKVYSVLIEQVERVIDFAGDAMTCWFHGNHCATRAVACAAHLHDAIRTTAWTTGDAPALALKVVVASGPAHRFVLGDAALRQLDVIAGATVTRAADGDRHARPGEVLVDEHTASAAHLPDKTVREWRVDPVSGARFAVVTHAFTALPAPQQDSPTAMQPVRLRDWLHKPLLEPGQSQMSEFRPCAALFVRFDGIDYDASQAGQQLDAVVRHIQSVASHNDGALLQLTVGDKGSYAYVNFGALRAHEDDARRAIRTALALRAVPPDMPFLKPLRIGVTSGIMHVGAYGGATRRVFGALGDDVNICARLMQIAAPGEILVSGQVQKAIETRFTAEARPPLPLKGKADPMLVFAVTGERTQRAVRLQEPNHPLPMVGRTSEMQTASAKLDDAARGRAQVLRIVAEAGMGKSRLVSEIIRVARKNGFICYGGTCQSDTSQTPYQAWRPIWEAFFNIDPEASLKRQIRALEGDLDDLAPERTEAAPLLGDLLNLDIPETGLTRTLEPQYRKSALAAMLADCVRAAAKLDPQLIIIEDVQWIDGISHELLDALSTALSDSRVCFVLTQRPNQEAHTAAAQRQNVTTIALKELTHAEAGAAIQAKLAQLYPMRPGAVPPALVEMLMTRTQGNPYFLEELLTYLHDRGLDPRDGTNLRDIELPNSLHALALSLIDQLSERERTTLHVASVIGRRFSASWLAAIQTHLGEAQAAQHAQAALDRLQALGVTALDTPAPDPAYVFKHAVLHEATYESMSYATRSRLHAQLARFLESQIATGRIPEANLIDTIAHHYGRSDDRDKLRVYLTKAADAALNVSAFSTALTYLMRLLTVISSSDPARSGLARKLGETHYRLGEYAAAIAAIGQAQAAATGDIDRAAALTLLGEVTSESGDHARAQTLLADAVPLARAGGDGLTLCQALYALGDAHWRAGRYDEAHAALVESLTLARARGDVTRELFALGRLAAVIQDQGDLDGAKARFTDMHARATAAGNRERAMNALMNLGQIADKQKEFARGQAYGHQALALARDIGAQQTVALCLIGQASTYIRLADYPSARDKLREGLPLAWRLGVRPWVVWAVTLFADLAYYDGQTERALALYGLAQRQPAFIHSFQYDLDARLAEWGIDTNTAAAGLDKGHLLDWDTTLNALLRL